MGEFEEKLNAFLSNPDAMAQVMNLAQSLNLGGEGGTEKAVAGTTVEDADISFTVRFCRTAEAVSSSGFRIVFREELYDILAVDHLNYKKRALKFRCRKVRR